MADSKKTRKIIIAAMILLLLLIAIVILLLVLLLGKANEPVTPPPGGVVFDPNAGDFVKPDGQIGNTGGVAIPGFGSWTIPPNVTEVVTDFYNPAANADKYHLTFEVRVLNDSEQGYEVIYKSGHVKANDHIQKVTLTRPFEPGEYDAVLFVQPYRVSDNTPTNNANLNFKLKVQ